MQAQGDGYPQDSIQQCRSEVGSTKQVSEIFNADVFHRRDSIPVHQTDRNREYYRIYIKRYHDHDSRKQKR
jgi:hypothetical protein